MSATHSIFRTILRSIVYFAVLAAVLILGFDTLMGMGPPLLNYFKPELIIPDNQNFLIKKIPNLNPDKEKGLSYENHINDELSEEIKQLNITDTAKPPLILYQVNPYTEEKELVELLSNNKINLIHYYSDLYYYSMGINDNRHGYLYEHLDYMTKDGKLKPLFAIKRGTNDGSMPRILSHGWDKAGDFYFNTRASTWDNIQDYYEIIPKY